MPPSRPTWFPKPYADAVQRLRVPLGFVLVAAFAWLSSPSLASLAWGLPLAAAGLALRAWAAGCLYKNQRLATGGPYAMTRNPLYLGTLTVAAGLVLATRRWELAVLFGAAFFLIYFPTIEQEEQHLRHLFPRDFPSYAARVPLLWPRLGTGLTGEPFTWSQYLRNQEYNAGAGLLLGSLILAAKLWFA
ncbi:MAG: isoprenylcysteine carboxylmethyltransferase family protein [Bryobacteraceae bacterium]|nr:isoprenylcysteine carboxylmethyltransferase family protein [Bryobacteraceae bacterium]